MTTQTKPLTSLDRDQHPAYLHEPYKSTVLRSPRKPLIAVPQTLSELTAPVFGEDTVTEIDSDLTRNARINGEPVGERIIVTGRLLDERGTPIRNALVEIWQANATGRYLHKRDQHDAPLDPNFTGAGRTLTDDEGMYHFTTLRPGAYPWGNHDNAWRPSHIHFSVFGNNFLSRLVTQMYFPGDPLHELDPILMGIPDKNGRNRLIADYAHDITQPEWALGYRFDIVVCGTQVTPFETREV